MSDLDPIEVTLVEGRDLMECEVPYKRKEEFKVNVPLTDWNDSTSTWRVPLVYLPELHSLPEVNIQKEVAKKYNKKYDKNRKKVQEIPDLSVELYDYQKIAVGEMLRKPHFLLALDMGLGKTLSSIGTALELRRQELLNGNEEILIVVPSALKKEWSEEIEDFTEADYTVIDGEPDERPEQWNDDSFFKIVNYALLDYDEEPHDKNWGAIFIDEATFIKNHDSQRTKNVKNLTSDRRYALTGTPVENDLSDMFNIMEFLEPDFFIDYWRFKNRYLQTEKRSMKNREWEETIGTKNVDEFKDKVEPLMFRRTKEDVKDQLPPISTKKIFVEMDSPQWAEYKRIKQDMYDRVEEEEDLAGHIQYLQMLCNSTELINRADRTEVIPFGDLETAHPKVEELKKLMKQIKNQDGKALIFTQWSSMVDLIEEEVYTDSEMKDNDINPVYLTGDSSEKERNEGVEEFKNDKDFLVSTDIFKYGVNLQHANFVIHVDSLWNPAVMSQRRDRIYRIGQENPVTQLFLLTKDTIEENIEETIAEKRDLFDSVVDDLNDLDEDEWIELA